MPLRFEMNLKSNPIEASASPQERTSRRIGAAAAADSAGHICIDSSTSVIDHDEPGRCRLWPPSAGSLGEDAWAPAG